MCYSVLNRLADVCNAELSEGDFVSCTKGKRVLSTKPEHLDVEKDEEGGSTSALLSCPVDGCICTYQKYYNLERHLLFEKCKFVSEKYTLSDRARLSYVEKVQKGITAQPTLTAPTASDVCLDTPPLIQGWALKGTKKVIRFNENQRQYLNDKFQIGQESGHKADAEKVSQDMRYTRGDKGQRRFKVDEFLTAQQIQGYFSRSSAKLRHAKAPQPVDDTSTNETDVQAAQEAESYSSARAAILQQCELTHPIVYDTLNICNLCTTNKLTRLSVAQLRLICSHYNMDVETSKSKRKAPYISFIHALVGSCSCTKV